MQKKYYSFRVVMSLKGEMFSFHSHCSIRVSELWKNVSVFCRVPKIYATWLIHPPFPLSPKGNLALSIHRTDFGLGMTSFLSSPIQS